jgi:hydroxymethylpyrimidine/phosphomethylpyrimidine kinase
VAGWEQVRLYEARVKENAKQNIAAINSKLNNIVAKIFPRVLHHNGRDFQTQYIQAKIQQIDRQKDIIFTTTHEVGGYKRNCKHKNVHRTSCAMASAYSAGLPATGATTAAVAAAAKSEWKVRMRADSGVSIESATDKPPTPLRGVPMLDK